MSLSFYSLLYLMSRYQIVILNAVNVRSVCCHRSC